MTTYYNILEVVLTELRDILEGRDYPDALVIGQQTPLLAEGAIVDSFDVVNLIIAVEDRLAKDGTPVEIIDPDSTTGVDSPFRTVDSLTRHILGKVNACIG